MGPEMRTDPTAATATNIIATRNGTSWLAPWVRDDGLVSTVVGIVVVLMAFLAFRARGQGAMLVGDPSHRIDPDQTYRYRDDMRGFRHRAVISALILVVGRVTGK
jgi:hypothetical protein